VEGASSNQTFSGKIAIKKIMKEILISMGVVFIFFDLAVFADNNASNEINIITARLFERINDSRFDDAAKLFHCQTNMSRSECANERKAISQMLRVMQREFGKRTIARLFKSITFIACLLVAATCHIGSYTPTFGGEEERDWNTFTCN
jgi:hypothetical protein